VFEDWKYCYPANVMFMAAGNWDKRTPVLHSAVAALDVTDAGYDEAFVRALGNIDTLLGGTRMDVTPAMRQTAVRMSKATFNPARVLTRAASLWCALKIHGLNTTEYASVDNLSNARKPERINNFSQYSNMCVEVDMGGLDILYLQLFSAGESSMLRVAQALTSETFPIRALSQLGIARLWPSVGRIRSLYSGIGELDASTLSITAEQVWMTVHRFCQLHDCHDVWLEVLKGMQYFLARPSTAGMVAGSSAVSLALPLSNLGIGIIGPLLAGLTVEGMKTDPVEEPSFVDYAYGAVQKTVFCMAAYCDRIQAIHGTHPVAVGTGRSRWAILSGLTHPVAARGHWLNVVRKTATEYGWDCVGNFIAGVCMLQTRPTLRTVLSYHRVPHWLQVIPHLSPKGLEELSAYLAPAKASMLPEAKVRYRYDVVGAVTPSR